MKKNTFMRVASALLVAVLLTTCAIAGTFAKYVTQASSEDSARVAYWGFKETTFTIENLFAGSYDNVASNDGADVIAPGTAGETTFAFAPQNANAPEVAYKITVDVDGTCDPTIVANTNIQWKLDDGEWGTFADMCNAIEALSTDTIAPNTFDPDWEFTSQHKIEWQWLINESSDVDDAQNIKDTAMGNADSLAEVSIKITIRVEQVD